MPKLKLIFGTVNSLPLGLQDAEIEKIYQRDYKPFITALYNFPQIVSIFQFSGFFLSWLEARHPEFADVLKEMMLRKQVEILGGTFYDCFLPLIPRSDRVGQFEKLTTWLRRKFGSRPRGGWIGETEWEPGLVSSLSDAGMDYVFLSDNHFSAAGIAFEDRFEPYITEDQGETLVVFPLFDDWGQGLLECEPAQIIEKIKSQSGGNDEKLITILVDGKRFGGSADEHKRWYKEKKLEEFFRLLSDADWLELIHPGKFLRQYPPHRRVYFPCGSRTELVKSFLTPEEIAAHEAGIRSARGGKEKRSAFFPGGFSRRFLTRYPESNDLYAKMHYTHILVSQIRGDKYRKSAALEELWKAQQSFAYWPSGRFGGIFRNALRKKAYGALISAEKLTRQQGVFIPSIVSTDFDMDLKPEFLFQGNQINAYVHSLGARLFELDYLPVMWNYLDTMSRAGANGEPADFYPRRAFIDHFFPAELGIDDFDKLDFPGDCCLANAPFELVKCDRERGELILEYSGVINLGGTKASVKIVKRFIFKGSQINLYYTLTNQGSKEVSLVFGCESNFSFYSKKAEDLKSYRVKDESRIPLSMEKAVQKEAAVIVFEDLRNGASLTFSSQEPAELWSLNVETNFPVEEGEAVVYQSSCIIPRWKINLDPGANWENRLNLKLETL